MNYPLSTVCLAVLLQSQAFADELTWPPELPRSQTVASDRSPKFLKPTTKLQPGVKIAKTPPTVDFLYYRGQTYLGNPWSVWGDSLAVGDKYYSAIGDHKGPDGNAFVYEYDAKTKKLRQIVDVRKLLKLPAGHYTPGKIHSRIDMGSDGWLYFSTHRGSTRVTIDKYHYKGDWILRHHPPTGKTEVVAHAPLAKQCLPTSVLDPDRLIFYAGTADGDRTAKRVKFLAYDCKNRKLLYSDDQGPYRYAIFARSTGRVYFQHGGRRGNVAKLVRFDPANPGPPQQIDAEVGLRAATQETSTGLVYTVDGDNIWEFNTKREEARRLGPAIVGNQTYIATLDVDPKTERYLYYIAGAHGGSQRDGTPLVQYDLKTGGRKVIAFLHPFYADKYGYTPMGTYGIAVSPGGERVYITWNGNRGGADRRGRIRFNTCALTVVHVPEAERRP